MKNREEFKRLWSEFGDIPINYSEDEDGLIDQDWHVFEKGTDIYAIWHWFEEEFDCYIGEIINGIWR